MLCNKTKIKIYHLVGTTPKSNRKIVESKEKTNTTSSHIWPLTLIQALQ